MPSRRRRPVVCSIGSTDPTAAAGLFADASAYAAHGVAATYVVVAVTAQNSRRVSAVRALDGAMVGAQLHALWQQVRPDAVRIGLMPDAAAIAAVRRFFEAMRRRPQIVIDPVMAASSGHRFSDDRALGALRRLLPLATIVTPNAAEAARLAGIPVRNVQDAHRAALLIAQLGPAVLVKGGHVAGRDSVDVLAAGDTVEEYRARRLKREMRGTGCVLAAALAARLARGESLTDAVRGARAYVRDRLRVAEPLGRGRPRATAGLDSAAV